MALLVLGSATAVLAQEEEHSDIELAIEGGRLVVTESIAEGEFGSELNAANTTDDPGFTQEGFEDDPPTSTFAGGQQVSFQTINLGDSGTNLLFWDGVGAPSFGTSPHDLEIERDGLFAYNLSDGNREDTIFAALDDGSFDDHLDFTLVELDSGNPTVPDAVQTGVYVFGAVLGSPNADPAVENSDPVFFVLASQGLDEEIHEAGISFVEANFVPEPGSQITMLIGIAMLMGLRRRWSRK